MSNVKEEIKKAEDELEHLLKKKIIKLKRVKREGPGDKRDSHGFLILDDQKVIGYSPMREMQKEFSSMVAQVIQR